MVQNRERRESSSSREEGEQQQQQQEEEEQPKRLVKVRERCMHACVHLHRIPPRWPALLCLTLPYIFVCISAIL